jgi:hypothetical protein
MTTKNKAIENEGLNDDNRGADNQSPLANEIQAWRI